METFLQICRENQGYKKQKKTRRWLIYFALNFNLEMKEFTNGEFGDHSGGQFMRTQIDYNGRNKNYEL